MAQVSSHGEVSVMGTHQTPFDTVCMLSGEFVCSLKGQADFSEKVKELMHVKNLMPDKARIHLKNTIHLI